MRKYLVLFREMVFLSSCVVGGGVVILSVADNRFSKKFKWIRPGELFDALPLFQVLPGIIGGHTAVYVGNRVAGFSGSVVALAGMALPSVLIFLAVSMLYQSIPVGHPLMQTVFLGLRAALTGILLDMVVRTWKKSVTGVYGPVAFAAALFLILEIGIPPGRVIVASLVAGVIIQAVRDRLGAKDGPTGEKPKVFRSFWAIPLLFLIYGSLAFGGGFVLVPVYMRDFVGSTATHLQILPNDFANIMALTELTPGPVAVNCATFFGFKLGGVLGAVLATMMMLQPGLVFMTLALKSIDRFRSSVVVRGVLYGVRPVTVALLTCATWTFAGMSVFTCAFGSVEFQPLGMLLAVGVFAAIRMRCLGALTAIFISAAVSLAWAALAHFRF